MMEASFEAFIILNTYPIVVLGTPISSSFPFPFKNPQFGISSSILSFNQLVKSIRIEDFNLLSDLFITQDTINIIYIFNQNKKCSPTIPLSNQNKQPRIQNKPIISKEAILKARDLILLASTLIQLYDEQSKLLDLLEIFKEYTEKGKLIIASNIITSQITHLESAIRKIESQAKTLAKNPIPNTIISTKSTFTTIAKKGEWNLISKGKAIKPIPINKKIEITQKHLILIKPEIPNPTSFSSLTIRNKINKAFQKIGIKRLVIAAATLSFNNNIIITTNDPFILQFLLEKKAI